MGKINQGIMGGFSGNVGNVVGSTWKGVDYMKSKPTHVANPKTAAQVAQRTKMKTLVLLVQFILVALVQKLWNASAVKMSGFNAFVKANLPAISGAGVITPGLLKMSIGPLPSKDILTAVYTAGTKTLVVTWDPTLDGELESNNDIAFVCVVDPTTKKAHAASGALRSTGTISIVLPADMAVNALTSTCFLSFKSNEPLIRPIAVSDSSNHAIAAV